MRVTSKGQVTIPQSIREKMGITPSTEIDFKEEGNRIYIVKSKAVKNTGKKFSRLRGIATIKMSTDEIMALTRGK